MNPFPNITRALHGTLRLTATVIAMTAVLALCNRLVGIAWPGFVE